MILDIIRWLHSGEVNIYFIGFIRLEDVNGVVFDFGSRSARVGYAGEDTPRSVIPSFTTRDSSAMSDTTTLSVNENALYAQKPNTEIRRIFKDGLGMLKFTF